VISCHLRGNLSLKTEVRRAKEINSCYNQKEMRKVCGFDMNTARGCGVGIEGSDQRTEETCRKAHPSKVILASEDELTNSTNAD